MSNFQNNTFSFLFQRIRMSQGRKLPPARGEVLLHMVVICPWSLAIGPWSLAPWSPTGRPRIVRVFDLTSPNGWIHKTINPTATRRATRPPQDVARLPRDAARPPEDRPKTVSRPPKDHPRPPQGRPDHPKIAPRPPRKKYHSV